MKRWLIALVGALSLLAGSSAMARVSVGVNIGVPGVYYGGPVYAPPPVYYPPRAYYGPRVYGPPPIAYYGGPGYYPGRYWGHRRGWGPGWHGRGYRHYRHR
jgi:hypothetical protein